MKAGKVNLRKACKRCGVWVCHECWDWRRSNASRAYPQQHCAKCGGVRGAFLPVTHRNPLRHVVVELHGRVWEL